MSRIYDLVHRTAYTYPADVTASYGQAWVTPRTGPDQRLIDHVVDIEPGAADHAEHVDYFGNHVRYFAVTSPHRRLAVTARSRVEVNRHVPDRLPDISWNDVASAVVEGDERRLLVGRAGMIGLREMVLPSGNVVSGPEVAEFGASTFDVRRPIAEAVIELSDRIGSELAYRTGSTTVHTTQVQLLNQAAGVCQDFAHLGLAVARGYGLPARYVSGYVQTQPGPGQDRRRGADASHAWFAVWVPGHGWLHLDPTNRRLVDEEYVILGWGRDYQDVPPLRGVIFSEGNGSTLDVEVDLVPAGTEPFV